KEPTLELLQSRFNTPLVDVAREFRVSLTMMKRLCRKLGIQRWPHRQIRSLDKLLFELEERISATTSARELSYLQEQVALLEKKRRLVTRGASSGLQSALRNALFMADP
ncbi:RWP-RK domain-containing protein, partial [Tribonema minus]